MYSFFKKRHSITHIKMLSTHVVRCYKGRCLISSYNDNIAIWLDKKDVSCQGDYIEFNIDHNESYFVSELYRMLAENNYHQEEEVFNGARLVSLFNKKKVPMNGKSCQVTVH